MRSLGERARNWCFVGRRNCMCRETAQLVRPLAALTEDLSSAPSTHSHRACTRSHKLNITIQGKMTCAEAPTGEAIESLEFLKIVSTFFFFLTLSFLSFLSAQFTFPPHSSESSSIALISSVNVLKMFIS